MTILSYSFLVEIYVTHLGDARRKGKKRERSAMDKHAIML